MSDDFEDSYAAVQTIRQSLKEWEKHLAASSCDKHGFGINLDSRFSGAKLEISIDSWAGYYGNSSCSSVFHVGSKPEIFKKAFVQVLNSQILDLLTKTANLIEAQSTKARLEYIEKLEKRTEELKAIGGSGVEGETGD